MPAALTKAELIAELRTLVAGDTPSDEALDELCRVAADLVLVYARVDPHSFEAAVETRADLIHRMQLHRVTWPRIRVQQLFHDLMREMRIRNSKKHRRWQLDRFVSRAAEKLGFTRDDLFRPLKAVTTTVSQLRARTLPMHPHPYIVSGCTRDCGWAFRILGYAEDLAGAMNLAEIRLEEAPCVDAVVVVTNTKDWDRDTIWRSKGWVPLNIERRIAYHTGGLLADADSRSGRVSWRDPWGVRLEPDPKTAEVPQETRSSEP